MANTTAAMPVWASALSRGKAKAISAVVSSSETKRTAQRLSGIMLADWLLVGPFYYSVTHINKLENNASSPEFPWNFLFFVSLPGFRVPLAAPVVGSDWSLSASPQTQAA